MKTLENLFEVIEQKEIYDTIQSRVSTPKSAYISLEDMASKFNIDMKSL
jgi:hypothetical protein